MGIIGTVESLWRYPVKSMRGEELDEMFVGFSGAYGDRLFAFRSSASPTGFPYLTAREQHEMLQYRPRFRQPEKAARPINWAEAESMAPGVNPVSADPTELMVDVETPDGETLAIDNPGLIDRLRQSIDEKHHLTLLRSERAARYRSSVCNRRANLPKRQAPPWINGASEPTSMWIWGPRAVLPRTTLSVARCVLGQKWSSPFWNVTRGV